MRSLISGLQDPQHTGTVICHRDLLFPHGFGEYKNGEKCRLMPHKTDDLSYQCLTTVLDGLDAMVYVSDMQSHELLYVNKYGRDIWGSDIQGKTCWQVLQKEQNGPCTFCTNDKLLKKDGSAGEVYVWEFQNTVNKRWYQCRDQAIVWVDGRTVRMEVATDITDRKGIEEALEAARKEAEELAYRDELTGLGNRRAFFEQGQRAFKQSKRFGRPISVIMMDVDHFKKINDNHGHAAGDRVLQALAVPLQTLVREIDIVARMGGEEFAFVLPETDLQEAGSLAERLRREIECIGVENGEEMIRITASLGVVASKDTDTDLETLLVKADDALYVAKKKGRNQIKMCP